MQIIYNGVDITQDIEIVKAEVTEDAGRTPDGIELAVSNSQNQWSGWAPKQGDTLELVSNGYSSGAMAVDEIEQQVGGLCLRATSVPLAGKTKRTQAWEGITLPSLVLEKAATYSLGTEFFGVLPHVYQRVDQSDRSDFGFLSARALLEGCSIKVTGGKIVLYSDKAMEDTPPVKEISPTLMLDDPKFYSRGGQRYGSCTVTWRGVSGTFFDPVFPGPPLTVTDVPVYSQGEAERFARGILRSHNKMEYAGQFITDLDCTVTAGNTVAISGLGLSDGVYFIDHVVHSFVEGLSAFEVHRVLGRY